MFPKTLKFMLAALLVACCGGAAWAQDGGSTAGTESVTMTKAQLASMSQGQRVADAEQAVGTIRATLASVNSLREQVRTDERDIIALNCINEKLSAIKGFTKVAEKAELALKAPAASQDEQVHQAQLVFLASDRVQALGEEAEQCTGKVDVHSGPDPELVKDIDEDVRVDNPTNVETTDVPTDPLPDASPYQ